MGIYYCNSDKEVMFECDTIRCPKVRSWKLSKCAHYRYGNYSIGCLRQGLIIWINDPLSVYEK